jgi:elongation factor G
MKEYASGAIRNVALAGHGGSGKTTLAEACLYLAGASERMGSVDDGNTVSDFLPEEIKRKSSVWTSLMAFEHGGAKFNLVDTPGYADFFGKVVSAFNAVENVVLVANATTGLEIGLEHDTKHARSHGLACFVWVNELDRERANFDHVFDSLHDKMHLPVVALTYPLGQESEHRGWIDVIEGKAYEDKAGKLTEVPLPDGCKARISELHTQLVEAVVECDDEAMEKYLEGSEISSGILQDLICRCVRTGRIAPVLCGSAQKLIGVKNLLDRLECCGVPPHEVQDVKADPQAPFQGFVFQTFSDPHTGRETFIKIVSGTLKRDADVINVDNGHHEKIAHLYAPFGKKFNEVSSMQAGDIALVLKLKNTHTNDSLSAIVNGKHFTPPDYPESLYALAIEPATHGDDDKLNEALAKLADEDPSFHVERNAETNQTVMYGLGDMHLQMLISRLHNAFGVNVKTFEPKIAYRETVRKSAKVEGKLKKQSGGHGQFAHVMLEVEPNAPGAGFEFVDKIVGGVVPRAFIPGVEEGIRSALHEGPLAGYPLVDIKVTLYDGKFHDVDSSYQTFKMAGAIGLRNGTREAAPVLLEPVMQVEVETLESHAGDVIGDLNGRRGQILGMEPTETGTVKVTAYVPDASLLSYPITLRSITHGQGTFTKKFMHYAPVPDNAAKPLIEEYQKRREAGH